MHLVVELNIYQPLFETETPNRLVLCVPAAQKISPQGLGQGALTPL